VPFPTCHIEDGLAFNITEQIEERRINHILMEKFLICLKATGELHSGLIPAMDRLFLTNGVSG
jgi:hypothetical protein